MKKTLNKGLRTAAVIVALASVSLAQGTIEKTGKVTQSVSGISMLEIRGGRNLGGSLKILSKTGSEVEIDYKKWARADSKSQAERFLDLIEVKVQTVPDRVILSILTPSDAPWEGSDFGVGLDVFVQLPEKMKLECDLRFMKFYVRGPFSGIKVKSEFSELNLEGARGPIEAITSFAPIKLTDINGSIKAETRYAAIEASQINVPFGSAIFQNTGGAIKLNDIRGPVEAYTSHFEIDANDIDAAEGSMVFRTSYSPIRANDVSGELICETSFGRVDINGASLTHGQSKVETSYSPINAEFNDIEGGQLFIYNNYNNINLSIPSAVSTELVAIVDPGGRIRSSNLPVRPTNLDATRLEGIIGDGTGRIELKINGIGTIAIEGR